MKKVLGWLAIIPIGAFAQNQFTGNITDRFSNPLQHVTVSVLNSNKRVLSNELGRFQFTENRSTVDVLLHHVGFQDTVITCKTGQSITISMVQRPVQTEEVLLQIFARPSTPIAVSELTSKDIAPLNLGQDMPFLLRFTPSVVVTSDNGTGIGYTGMRIRGSDASRVSVLINGIPLNDAESHGVFWVNMPDFASSTTNIQIQRGVGTSVNGAGAFGGSVNIITGKPISNFAEYSTSGGSFGTLKNTLRFHVQTDNKLWSLEGRVSDIRSNGYIDRATSRLQSYYFSATRTGDKSVLRIIQFSGKERTYQSWYGTPESRIKNDTSAMNAYADRNGLSDRDRANLLQSGRTYNYYTYANEVDQYQQDHLQVHYTHYFKNHWTLNSAAHMTHGAGFYEQYRTADAFQNYGLSPLLVGGDTINSGDFIRRRWLDNFYYGMVFTLKQNIKIKSNGYFGTFGGGINQYLGHHFGQVIWAEWAQNVPKDYEYYRAQSNKIDANLYYQGLQQWNNKWSTWIDLQLRKINYQGTGLDNTLLPANFTGNYLFFNPKVGWEFVPVESQRVFGSISVGQKEPIRSDFVDHGVGNIPQPEKMLDWEMGYRITKNKWKFEANLYWMQYRNQLVLTGALNDVGTPLRVNVPHSFRRGLELQGQYDIIPKTLQWTGSITISQNKIKQFNELIFNYDNYGYDTVKHNNTDIAMSPNLVFSSQLSWSPTKSINITWMNQLVGKQYLDNCSNEESIIKKYWVNDLRFSYSVKTNGNYSLRLNAIINNLFQVPYSSNGYNFSYIYGTKVTENFYYPQAGRNILIGATFRF